MRDPAERIVQRLEKELAQVEHAGIKPLELSAHLVTLHAVVGSSLRHTDLECSGLQAERNVLANSSLAASPSTRVLSVKLKTGSSSRALLRNYVLNKRLQRLRTLNGVVAKHLPQPDLGSLHAVSLHTEDLPLSEAMKNQGAWCRSCTVHDVESSFFRAMSTPNRLMELKNARQALELNAADPTPALVADCYNATQRMRSSTVEPGLVGRAKEVEREIFAATSLVQQTSYSVLEELERRAVYEHLSSTSATFLSSSMPFDEKAPDVALPLQTLAALWAAFCKAGVEGRSPRAAFLEMADSFAVKRHASAAAAEQLLILWEKAARDRTTTPPTHWVIVSREDAPIYTSSSVVRSFVAITSGRANVVVAAVGPHTAALLSSDGAAVVLGEAPVGIAQQVAAMTQSLVQNGGVLEDPLEAFAAASALSASTS